MEIGPTCGVAPHDLLRVGYYHVTCNRHLGKPESPHITAAIIAGHLTVRECQGPTSKATRNASLVGTDALAAMVVGATALLSFE